MTHSFEIRPDLDEGIDRKVLSQLRNRFLTLNAGRLGRANEGLSTRQQSVLALLPLFFHVNHPLLPGYVSSATPAGVSNYEPDAQALAEAQRLTRSFSYKPRRGNPSQPIHGIFLMGSLGTLAQADQSDMDVWICHDANLSPEAVLELRKKCQALETWAATMGAEAHFFLIDPQRFVLGERDAQLSGDDCGTTQHYLLLDEFYRTAIWLAGRTPIWWLVPVYEEARYAEYTHTLLSKRFIREDEVLDLGNMSHIPPGEFIGAGLWQLFKGIESPYKSVLKLLLIEAYASEHPQVQCLSMRLKKEVFANRVNLDELDPYMMVYRRIEEYLLARGFRPVRIKAVGDREPLAQDVSMRANALAADWTGQYLARKGDLAGANLSYSAAILDYEAAGAEAKRLAGVYEQEIARDKVERAGHRAAAGLMSALSVAAALAAGGGYYSVYTPTLVTKLEQDEHALAELNSETTQSLARAAAIRSILAP